MLFNLDAEAPSLELCKKLKKLGYPQQGGGWFWIKEESPFLDTDIYFLVFSADGESYLKRSEKDGEYFETNLLEDRIKAPTCRELEEWLLKANGFFKSWRKYDYRFEFCVLDSWQTIQGIGGTFEKLMPSTKHTVEANTIPNARAEMLIWLAENGYVKFEKERNEADRTDNDKNL